MIEATGWTPKQIDDMEVDRVLDLLRHWKDEPPLGVVVRAYLGYDQAEEQEPIDPAPKEITPAQYDALVGDLKLLEQRQGHGRLF